MTTFYDAENRRVLKRIGNGVGFLLYTDDKICIALPGTAGSVSQNRYASHFSGLANVPMLRAVNVVRFRRTRGSGGSILRDGPVLWSTPDHRIRAERALARITRKRIDLS